MLFVHAEQDETLPWPGGRAALWRAASEAYARAAELGLAEGRELAEYAEERAREVERGS
jgi:hypothetical protein